MRKKYLHLILFTALCFSLQTTYGQYVLLEADKAFEQYNFEKAIDLYEQAYQKKPTLHAAQRLATSYSLQSNYKQTESWAAIAAGMDKRTPDNVLAYAKALQQNSKYSEAKEQYLKYAALKPDVDPQIKSMWIASCDSAMQWMIRPNSFTIKNEKELNSAESDWGVILQNNAIIFTSDRKHQIGVSEKSSKPFLKFDGAKSPNKSVYTWTGNQYLRLYTKKESDSVVIYPINAGTDYHVGPITFNMAGSEAFFTITRVPEKLDYKDARILKGKLATSSVEIYSLTKDLSSGQWSATPIPFKYNKSTEYTVTDPFITADGKSLYFASNMPGGKGGLDLYVCHRASDDQWETPVNLIEINTEGNDRSPSVGADGKFYFSTDGRVGMGGLDIFSADLQGGQLAHPKNLNYPINSPQDDFSFNLITANTGYLASNRFGGLGSDDIYSFTAQIKADFSIAGTVYNKATGKPLANAFVTLSKTGETGIKTQTDADGNFKFNLENNSDYTLNGEKTNFRNDELNFSTQQLNTTTVIKKDLHLTPIIIDQAIKIENIYYDFDKANIRRDAAIELDKLVKLMKDNPTIWIELSSHTDSRGNDAYNLKLSQKRAEAAVQYIISKGISKNRIAAAGYGESQLLNNCINGAKCTTEQHQLNRRTEFKITKQ